MYWDYLRIQNFNIPNLKENELREIFLGEYNKSILRILCGHNIDIDVLEIIKALKNINVDLLKDCLNGENNFFRILCYSNTKFHFGKYLEFLVKSFGVDFVMNLLAAKDEIGATILHDLSKSNENDFEETCRGLIKHLGKHLVKILLMIANDSQESIFHKLQTENCSDLKISKFIKFLIEEYDKEFVLAILKTKNIFGSTVISNVCRSIHMDFWKFLTFLISEFGKKDVKKILVGKDNSNETLFYKISYSISHEAFMGSLKVISYHYDVGFVKKLLTTGTNGTLLNNLVNHNKNTHFDFTKKLMETKEIGSDSILHTLCKTKENLEFMEFLEFWISNTDKAVARQSLLALHPVNGTILHLLCEHHQNKPDLIEVVKVLVSHFDADLLGALLPIKIERIGSTCLHHFALHKPLDFVEYYKYFKLQFGTNFTRELCLSLDSKNSTILHILAEFNQATSFVELIRLMSKD